jgi:hypothetical protein
MAYLKILYHVEQTFHGKTHQLILSKGEKVLEPIPFLSLVFLAEQTL